MSAYIVEKYLGFRERQYIAVSGHGATWANEGEKVRELSRRAGIEAKDLLRVSYYQDMESARIVADSLECRRMELKNG